MLRKVLVRDSTHIAQSSAESELLATVRGATEGVGLISLVRDLGMEFLVWLHVDASGALGIVERRGVGRIRHLDVGLLFYSRAVTETRQKVKEGCWALEPRRSLNG